MANYTLTAANVFASTGATYDTVTAGETITAGQPVYYDSGALDAANRPKAKLGDANASAATATIRGIAGNSASNNQPLRVITSDPAFTHGLTTVAAGDIIIVSATAGALAPAADLASGWYPTVAIVATSATQGVLGILSGTEPKA